MVNTKKITEKEKRARGDRTLLAIVLQVVALNFFVQPIADADNAPSSSVIMLIKIVPLLATTIWMFYNLRYEEDADQRQKNTKIELIYCLVQLAAALAGYMLQQHYYAGMVIISLAVLYILVINPLLMNRKLATKGKNDKKI